MTQSTFKTWQPRPLLPRKYDQGSPLPFYFQRVDLRGVNCFRGPDVQSLILNGSDEAQPKWTIILGNNSTGKSTLLKILASVDLTPGESIGFDLSHLDESVPDSVNTGDLMNLQEVFENSATESFVIHVLKDASFVSVFGSAVSLGESEQKSRVEENVECSIVWLHKRRGDFLAQYCGHNIGAIEQSGRVLRQHCELRQLIVAYGPWRRLGKSSPYDATLKQLWHTRHIFDPSVSLVNPEQWLLELDYLALAVENVHVFRAFSERVHLMISEMFPDKEISGVRIQRPNTLGDSPRVYFLTPYGEVPTECLGFGFQSLFAWVIDFIARMYHAYPESPNPLEEPAICLIDEIDLHLHPSWQQKLLGFLSKRFPKTQFIATAHSPLIVQAAEEIGANVVVLRREGDHVVIDNDPISVKGWRVDQILSSELFEQTPLRAGDTQEWMNRRTALLKKAKLTAKEKAELQTLNTKAEDLPVGSTASEVSLNDRLKNAVELLEKAAKGQKK